MNKLVSIILISSLIFSDVISSLFASSATTKEIVALSAAGGAALAWETDIIILEKIPPGDKAEPGILMLLTLPFLAFGTSYMGATVAKASLSDDEDISVLKTAGGTTIGFIAMLIPALTVSTPVGKGRSNKFNRIVSGALVIFAGAYLGGRIGTNQVTAPLLFIRF